MVERVEMLALTFRKNFLYCVKTLPKGVQLATYYGKSRGSVIFDGPVFIPAIHERDSFDLWMSLTPMEMITLRGGVRAAKGHTVVAGLGLGYQLIEISKKKSVKKVTLRRDQPRAGRLDSSEGEAAPRASGTGSYRRGR